MYEERDEDCHSQIDRERGEEICVLTLLYEILTWLRRRMNPVRLTMTELIVHKAEINLKARQYYASKK